MKLGDRVRCSGYIKKTGNHYEIENSKYDYPECCFWDSTMQEGVEVEDFHVCDRYRTVEASFTGVFVGTTILNTRLTVELEQHPYTGEHYRTGTDRPEKFAVVYYADNKKRLVPLDMIELAACDEGGEC